MSDINWIKAAQVRNFVDQSVDRVLQSMPETESPIECKVEWATPTETLIFSPPAKVDIFGIEMQVVQVVLWDLKQQVSVVLVTADGEEIPFSSHGPSFLDMVERFKELGGETATPPRTTNRVN